MTLDTTELRRLRGEYHSVLEAHESGLILATPEYLHRVETTYGTALDNAAPALLDAADELARVKAVMASYGTVEALSRVIAKAMTGGTASKPKSIDVKAAQAAIAETDRLIWPF